MDKKDETPTDVHFRDFAPAIEFICWVVATLLPVLRLINGPPVTSDQSTVQMALFGIALLGGVGLRLRRVLGR